LAILSGLSIEQIQADRSEVARKYAAKWGHILVLKGAFTVIASPEGKTATVPVATSALAKAGTGDVLAGLITGLLAQGVLPFDAAVAGAWIHAMAGLLAEASLGPASVLASDLLNTIRKILSDLNSGKLN
jgi:NAD(P)H-hydrate epimerase